MPTSADDATAQINLLMHAQGHALQARDTARIAESQLADAPGGLDTLALALAQFADAISGLIDAQAQSISDEHGLNYGRDRDD